MKIKFNILNQEIDLTDVLKENKEWWFRNCSTEIPIDTEIKDLTEDQKKCLIRLAIYEGYLSDETLWNTPLKSFTIIN